MSRRSPFTHVLLFLAFALGGVLFVTDLMAAPVRDVVLGDEIDAEIAADEVLGYRVTVVAGTDLDVRLEAEADDEADPGKSDGSVPVLALLDPTGAQVALDATAEPRIRHKTAASGTYVVEVRAGTFSGEVFPTTRCFG